VSLAYLLLCHRNCRKITIIYFQALSTLHMYASCDISSNVRYIQIVLLYPQTSILIVTRLIKKGSASYQLEDSRRYLRLSANGVCSSLGKPSLPPLTISRAHTKVFRSGPLQLQFCNIIAFSVPFVCRTHLIFLQFIMAAVVFCGIYINQSETSVGTIMAQLLNRRIELISLCSLSIYFVSP
jgi:hypothetical protein